MTDPDFRALAEDAGLPTNEDQIRAEFEKILDNEELVITNDSPISSLWSFITAIATKPVLWLIDFIVGFVLVQSFIATATGIYLDIHARGFGLQRKRKSKAEGFIQFSRITTSGELIIPAGTVVQSQLINGRRFSITSINEQRFSDGEETITILCRALSEGSDYNLGANQYTQLETPITGVSVTNIANWITKPGNDEEENDQLRERILNRFLSASEFHTDAAYRTIISTHPGVLVNNIFFEYGVSRGWGAANAYIMFESGQPSETFINSVNGDIQGNGNHGLGDDLLVLPIPENAFNIACTEWFTNRTGDEEKPELISRIENIIKSAFRQNNEFDVIKTRPNELFSFSQLADDLHSLVPQLLNVSFNRNRIDAGLFIARLNSLTVAENA